MGSSTSTPAEEEPATQTTSTVSAADGEAKPTLSLAQYTREELAKHNSESDAWIAVESRIYNVTSFIDSHPGGSEVLIDSLGTDATAEFLAALHSESAKRQMKKYLVGQLNDSAIAISEQAECTDTLSVSADDEKSNHDHKAYVSRTDLNQTDICVMYATKRGMSKEFAERTKEQLLRLKKEESLRVRVIDLSELDAEDLDCLSIGLFIVSTYENGTPPLSTQPFFTLLHEMVEDCRVSKTFLKNTLDYSVFGCGNSLYEEHYNQVALDLNADLKSLGSQILFPIRLGDSNLARETDHADVDSDFESWLSAVTHVLCDRGVLYDPNQDESDDECDKHETQASQPQTLDVSAISDAAVTTGLGCGSGSSGLTAIEEIGSAPIKSSKKFSRPLKSSKIKKGKSDDGCEDGNCGCAQEKSSSEPQVCCSQSSSDSSSSHTDCKEDEDLETAPLSGLKVSEIEPDTYSREMLTIRMKSALEKQGYKVIGSHSGVKLCRWTKSFLRGRGGCYKHTCYGIMSYGCMEMTPSLACANKCTFCWRHHTNPVGKEWKWKYEDPDFIVEQAINKHLKMVSAMRGVPGVTPERFAEAQRIRHCALSLVGEPIMYPKINQVIRKLHENNISTFLVTNAQFPQLIQNLDVVTQLYVSIDASDPIALKKVDRPLFKDYWQRFLDCLDALREKKQRTVYRLTLVKGDNMDGIANYARLILRGRPSFIEIKGVTFAGDNNTSDITMDSVPFHFEVKWFCEKLVSYLGKDEYQLACEHEHSCLCLIAQSKFNIDGDWHTWIDYPKFFELVNNSDDDDFDALDYVAKTPEWAVYGSEQAGFNPSETRFRKQRGKSDSMKMQKKQLLLNQKIELAKEEIEKDRRIFMGDDEGHRHVITLMDDSDITGQF